MDENRETIPLRALNNPADIANRVEQGTEFTVTRGGQPVMTIRRYDITDPPVYPFRTDPMGEDPLYKAVPVPDLPGAAMTQEEVDAALAEGYGRD